LFTESREFTYGKVVNTLAKTTWLHVR